mmetsp:Transcript_27858/g.47646  ORF Transcript_27858/g.47646 Transcript_27858/m.47646 type:complete len:384 (-) Transcript_27858:258-1409(-)
MHLVHVDRDSSATFRSRALCPMRADTVHRQLRGAHREENEPMPMFFLKFLFDHFQAAPYFIDCLERTLTRVCVCGHEGTQRVRQRRTHDADLALACHLDASILVHVGVHHHIGHGVASSVDARQRPEDDRTMVRVQRLAARGPLVAQAKVALDADAQHTTIHYSEFEEGDSAFDVAFDAFVGGVRDRLTIFDDQVGVRATLIQLHLQLSVEQELGRGKGEKVADIAQRRDHKCPEIRAALRSIEQRQQRCLATAHAIRSLKVAYELLVSDIVVEQSRARLDELERIVARQVEQLFALEHQHRLLCHKSSLRGWGRAARWRALRGARAFMLYAVQHIYMVQTADLLIHQACHLGDRVRVRCILCTSVGNLPVPEISLLEILKQL